MLYAIVSLININLHQIAWYSSIVLQRLESKTASNYGSIVLNKTKRDIAAESQLHKESVCTSDYVVLEHLFNIDDSCKTAKREVDRLRLGTDRSIFVIKPARYFVGYFVSSLKHVFCYDFVMSRY